MAASVPTVAVTPLVGWDPGGPPYQSNSNHTRLRLHLCRHDIPDVHSADTEIHLDLSFSGSAGACDVIAAEADLTLTRKRLFVPVHTTLVVTLSGSKLSTRGLDLDLILQPVTLWGEDIDAANPFVTLVLRNVVATDLPASNYKNQIVELGLLAARQTFPEHLHINSWANVQELADLIKGAVTARKPFSVVRLGDGEGRILGYPHVLQEIETFQETVNYMFGPQALRQLFGYFGHDALSRGIGLLRDLLVQAIENADAIGLPSPKHLEVPATPANIDALVGFAAAHIFSKRYTSRMMNGRVFDTFIFSAFHQRGLFDSLLHMQPYLGLIAHSDFGAQIAARFRIGEVETFRIPGHHSFMPEVLPHYPDRYRQVIDSLVVPFEGAIFLVAAGYLGKIYCDVIKQRGGIGIDIGVVFDGWFGVGRKAGNPNPKLLL